MRKVFLDELPRCNIAGRECINWRESSGYKVPFVYDDVEGLFEILDYDKKSEKLSVKYKDKINTINSTDFKNCKISKVIMKRTDEFKVEIGQVFKDEKRDLIITDREYRDRVDNKGNNKWYKYTCNVCKWTEGWIVEGNLLGKRKQGCACCSGKTVVEGINDIPTTASWMVKYFQGGYDEAKLYTKSCSAKINPTCPTCKNTKEKPMTINYLYGKKSISCKKCSDGISYPEKLMINILSQAKTTFEFQLTKTTFGWCGNKRYDFYLPEYNCIIETHGRQHYDETGGYHKCLKEQKENDRIKKELALANGIKHYIELDCRESNLDWIKSSILDSELSKLFDISKIDWLKCEEYAINSNIVREVCDYWNNKEECETTVDLGRIFNCDYATINTYLIKGENLGWIKDYKKEKKKSNNAKIANNNRQRCAKAVEVFKENLFLGKFDAISDIVRQSEELFGTKMSSGNISQVCLGRKPQYKGFTFKYVDE